MSNDQPQETLHQSGHRTDALREKYFLLRSERPDADAALGEAFAEVEHWRTKARQEFDLGCEWMARAEAAEDKLSRIWDILNEDTDETPVVGRTGPPALGPAAGHTTTTATNKEKKP